MLTKGRKGPLVQAPAGAQRLTFPFPFVHHQPHRLESGTTVGKENSPTGLIRVLLSLTTVVIHFPLGHPSKGKELMPQGPSFLTSINKSFLSAGSKGKRKRSRC